MLYLQQKFIIQPKIMKLIQSQEHLQQLFYFLINYSGLINLIDYFLLKTPSYYNQDFLINSIILRYQKKNPHLHHKKSQTDTHHFVIHKYYLLDIKFNFYNHRLFLTILQQVLALFILFNNFSSLIQLSNKKTIFYYLISILA